MASAQADGLSKLFPLNYFLAALSCGSHVRENMRKGAIKLVTLKMIFFTEANNGSYFPAEDVIFPSFVLL